MKLLLTSSGFTNKSISDALLDLISKPFNEQSLIFIPTAANIEKGDKSWLIEDFNNCKKLGFASIDIVDFSALPKDIWQQRIDRADILLFGGGNVFYLMDNLKRSGFAELLPELLEKKVYVGISAGSMVTSPTIYHQIEDIYYPEAGVIDEDKDALGFVNFYICPHFNSSDFPKARKENLERLARELRVPIYGIDDQTAVKIKDDKTEVISEGSYLEL